MSYYSDIDNPLVPSRKRKLYNRYFSKQEGRILDVGCSTGNFIQHAPERTVGFDLDADALKVAVGRNFVCVRGNISNGLPFATESFQAVNCDSIVEHVSAPVELLREVHRVLIPGGTAVLITPNIYRVKHRFWRDYTHVHPFCLESLKRLAYDAGFAETLLRIYSLNYLKWISQFGGSSRQGSQAAWWFLEDLIGFVFASNIVLVARK